MRTDSRLSRMLHLLLHMERFDRPVTSEDIGKMLHTNPVVARRTLAGLKSAGLVDSANGAKGGWTLSRPLSAITVYDVYCAVGAPGLFALDWTSESGQCLVAKAVTTHLGDAFAKAETLVLEQFKAVTLADLSAQVDSRFDHWQNGHGQGSALKPS